MLHYGLSGGARRGARLIMCAALLAGGAVFAAGEGPAPAPAPADAGVRSVPSMTGGVQGPEAMETQPTVSTGLSSTAAIGTQPTVTSGPSSTLPQHPAPKQEDIVESMHESLSYGFLATATWLDSFFGNQRYEAESNESQFKVQFNAFRQGQSGMEYQRLDYTLRLVLPQLRKKTRLVIAGDPTADTSAAANQPGVPPAFQQQPATSKNVGGALEYFPVESNRSSFSIRTGLKLHYANLSVVMGPRYRYLIPLDPWALRFTQEVDWSSQQPHWLSRTTIDFERPLPSGLFFRSTLEGVWREDVNGFPYALGFTLRQPLDPNRALLYSWINFFQTSPTNELVQELFVFGYRQRFWKPWLFLEIDPQVSYPRTNGFRYTPGILFRIELVFGQYSSFF